MDKSSKLMLKTIISGINNLSINCNNTLKTLEFLINQQKTTIKRLQDEGLSENVYEKEIVILDVLNDCLDNLYNIEEITNKCSIDLKNIKTNKI